MADFVFKANVARYERLLTIETDSRRIATLHELLAEEEAKYAKWREQNSSPKAAE